MLPLVVLYVAVTVVRLWLYFVHMALAPLLLAMQDDQSHPHFLSDHIFLGDSRLTHAGRCERAWYSNNPQSAVDYCENAQETSMTSGTGAVVAVGFSALSIVAPQVVLPALAFNPITIVVAGASLVAIFNAEAHILIGHLRRPWAGMTRLDRRIIVAALVLTVVLFALTAVRCTSTLLLNTTAQC